MARNHNHANKIEIKPKAVYGIHKDKNIQHNPAVQKTATQY